MNFADGRVDGDAVVVKGGTRLAVAPALARCIEGKSGAHVRVGVRAEDIRPVANDIARSARLSARVVLREPLGHETLTHLRIGELEWVARGTREFAAATEDQTPVFLDLDRIHIFWKDSGRRVDAIDEPATAPGTTPAPA